MKTTLTGGLVGLYEFKYFSGGGARIGICAGESGVYGSQSQGFIAQKELHHFGGTVVGRLVLVHADENL